MIIIVGKTCSGKSSVARILQERYGINRILTYTTRPPREGEGLEYHFVADEDFEMLKSKDFFFETTQYQVACGETWKYGTAISDLNNDSCIVMNPDGLKKFKKLLDPNEYTFTVVYLNVTEGCQWNRLRLRGGNGSSDEASRRVEADRKDFAEIGSYYDFAITTDKTKVEDIAFLIYNYNNVINKRI